VSINATALIQTFLASLMIGLLHGYHNCTGAPTAGAYRAPMMDCPNSSLSVNKESHCLNKSGDARVLKDFLWILLLPWCAQKRCWG
jgi:hypothetical protein